MVMFSDLPGAAFLKIDIYFQRVMAPELLVELDDPVGLVADLARYAKAGHADGNTEGFRLGFRHRRRAHRNLGAALDNAVMLRHEPGQRTVERKIQHFDNVESNSTLAVLVTQPGIYLVNLIKNGQAVITQKLVSK